MQDLHGIIPWLFDYWADPVAHLLLLKSSMVRVLVKIYAVNTHILTKRKYYCNADIPLGQFGLRNFADLLVWLNPNQSSWR